jgi:hypothetical protein
MPQPLPPMHPTDRYVVLRGRERVFSANTLDWIVWYVWGRDALDGYTVLDGDTAYPVVTTNLIAWLSPLVEAARTPRAGGQGPCEAP